MENPNFIGQIPPETVVSQGPIIFDASLLDMGEEFDALREDIKLNRIEYIFPDKLAQVDLIEECRALTQLNDFDIMYDLTMQMLEKRTVVINLKNDDGSRTELANFYVVNKYMNLRAFAVINEFPCLVTWLVEFMATHISKKLPTPGKSQLQAQESKETKGSKKAKKKPEEKETTQS
jgi:hypothetical protein